MRVALTGGIASGKSFCLARFRELGAVTVDADALARQVVTPGSAALTAIVSRFGRAVLQADGSLDRAALGAVVFADADARRDLEAIVHPAVYARLQAWFETAEGAAPSSPPVAIAEIPLLYETGREGEFDAVVVAACDEPTQIARLQARDGVSADEARRRLAAQWPIEDKRRRAGHVIDTSGSEEDTRQAVDRVWRALLDARDGPSGR